MEMKIQMSGLDEIMKKLFTLDKRLATRTFNRAIRKSADIILDEARTQLARQVGVKTGTLTGSLSKRKAVAIRRYRNGRVYYAAIGPGGEAHHAWLIEHGHNIVRGGKVVGRTRPRPFMSDTFEKTQAAAESAIVDIIAQEVANT